MITRTRLCAILLTSGLLCGCKKSPDQNQSKASPDSTTASLSDTVELPPAMEDRADPDFHIPRDRTGLKYAWTADFDADGSVDSVVLLIPNNIAFCSHEIFCVNPWSKDKTNKMVSFEPGLLITLGTQARFFLQDSGYFRNPETVNGNAEMNVDDRVRIIRPNDSTYSDWKARVSFNGDVIGVIEYSAIESILFFNGKTFILAYSDEEP